MNAELEQSLKQFATDQLSRFGIRPDIIEVRDNGLTYSVICQGVVLLDKERRIEFYNILVDKTNKVISYDVR
jgi:hypothetical protein